MFNLVILHEYMWVKRYKIKCKIFQLYLYMVNGCMPVCVLENVEQKGPMGTKFSAVGCRKLMGGLYHYTFPAS